MFFICFSFVGSLVTSGFACSIVSIGGKSLSSPGPSPLQLNFHFKCQSLEPCNQSPELATLSLCALKKLQTEVDNSDREK